VTFTFNLWRERAHVRSQFIKPFCEIVFYPRIWQWMDSGTIRKSFPCCCCRQCCSGH